MKLPGGRDAADESSSPRDAEGEQTSGINLGAHSAGSAAATIRKVAELLGYGIVASGPASFRLTRPVRSGIRRVDQVVNVSLHNGRDGLWVEHDGPLDPRLIEQLQAQARLEEAQTPSHQPAPVANLPRPDRDDGPMIEVRPGVAPQGLIDFVPGATSHFDPPQSDTQPAFVIYLPDGTPVSGDGGVVIGREPDVSFQPRCATGLVLDDPGVSKTHVAVWLDADAITIEDLHSTNGSEWELNGQTHRCDAAKPIAVLAPKVNLLIGSARLVLEKTR